MSSSLASRPLSTTEELEKLEQSITLTLQEIDHNFSRAHRIVTSSILPVVEQYGEHCRAVWDASKFWKQFFEAAANVSLSGYEELANGSVNGGGGDDGTTANEETIEEDASAIQYTRNDEESLLLSDDGDGDLSGSTPRVPKAAGKGRPVSNEPPPQFADMDSPYETLRREMAVKTEEAEGGEDESTLMHFDDTLRDKEEDDDDAAEEELLAQRTARLPDMSMMPRPSPDERNRRVREDEQAALRRQKDPLLHRGVLGKDYRIQATPHRSPQRPVARLQVTRQQKEEQPEKKSASAWSSPMSSPEMAVPQLRSAAFLSPVKSSYRSKLAAATAAATKGQSGPRTPGVSVQTPRPKRTTAATGAAASVFDDDESGAPGASSSLALEDRGFDFNNNDYDYDDDNNKEDGWSSGDDLYGGMSPPKTISFALPPSKLLQTPAREASKRIVNDILMSAGDGRDGGGDDDDDDSLGLDDGGLSEYSPTMVKTNANILDDTF